MIYRQPDDGRRCAHCDAKARLGIRVHCWGGDDCTCNRASFCSWACVDAWNETEAGKRWHEHSMALWHRLPSRSEAAEIPFLDDWSAVGIAAIVAFGVLVMLLGGGAW